MLFIFGGAHQGMEEYAREQMPSARVTTVTAAEATIDFSADIIVGLENYVRGCMKRGTSAQAYFAAQREKWQHCTLIGMDFSCGVVPMRAELRLWRDENGRFNNYLAGEAEGVVRMFCGLAQKLK